MPTRFFQQDEDCFEQALKIEDNIVPLRDRDRILTADVADVLGSHVSLHDLRLRYVVRGGVVHLRGKVASEDERRRVRRVIGRVRGIHAIWDTLLVPGQTHLKIIDIGCGTHKQIPWATGIDRHPLPGVDVVTDLEAGLPFVDNELDHVYAIHVLEHVRDLVSVMNEVHRCLQPTGILHVMVPNCESVNAIADPTHVRFFNLQSFKFFCKASPGVRSFHPLIVSGDRDNILADLEPVKDKETMPGEMELSRYFD